MADEIFLLGFFTDGLFLLKSVDRLMLLEFTNGLLLYVNKEGLFFLEFTNGLFFKFILMDASF